MTPLLFKLTGGIGLFLMGMVLLTDGLKSFAGDALRQALVRFTGRPIKAFASGALATALVQSSSATTVAVIGFVSAGLLTFPQTVGVVMGASLGTTITGWLVSVLGLKISVGFYALPLVGVGAFLKLLARGRWKSFGLALAGFGLIFSGIETLQDGMRDLSGLFMLAGLPSAGLSGHLVTMLIGGMMTVVMQSSSAAVATTLTALHTASINFEQATSLVIGASIGTTVTGALAAIGANVSTKRTALAHVLFNTATGLIAAAALPLLLGGIRLSQEHLGLNPGATSLAAFHTAFIAVGAAVFLPSADRFARWIERLLPEKGPALTRHLDPTLLNVPAVALEATRRALSETAREMFTVVRDRLGDRWEQTDDMRIAEIHLALEEAQRFIAKIPPVAEGVPLSQLRISQLHAIDHLVRLRTGLRPPEAAPRLMTYGHVQAMTALLRGVLELGEAGLHGIAPTGWPEMVEQKSLELSELHRRARPSVLRETASAGRDPITALDALDAMRWTDRAGYHAWRICQHLAGEGQSERLFAQDSELPEV